MVSDTAKITRAVMVAGVLSTVAPITALAAEPQASTHDGVALSQLKSQIEDYRAQIAQQKELMAKQAAALSKMEKALKQQNLRLIALEERTAGETNTAHLVPAVAMRPADGAIGRSASGLRLAADQGGPAPVGQAPKKEERPQVQILPDLGGVLTPKGKLSIEPSLEFNHTSTNQLTFRGISIVQGLLIGVIDASDIRGDTFIGALTGRYGVTNRFEVEGKVPYLYRRNHETNTPATSNAQPFKTSSTGHDIGDVELAAHYQINDGRDDWPVFVGNLRYKSNTGKSPFDVAFDSATGVAQELPTGSGFHTLEPSLTIIYPSDPVVFFSNIQYDYSFATDVNKVIAKTCGPQNDQDCLIGRITPGQSYGATLGMAVALNERTSFSLGYQHNYLAGTSVTINGVKNKSDALQAGALLVGASYQVSPRVGINFSTQIGVTTDAPDVRVLLRIPILFDLL